MVGEYEDVSKKHAEVVIEALIHELKPFVFKNTYFSAGSRANSARFDKMITNK